MAHRHCQPLDGGCSVVAKCVPSTKFLNDPCSTVVVAVSSIRTLQRRNTEEYNNSLPSTVEDFACILKFKVLLSVLTCPGMQISNAL